MDAGLNFRGMPDVIKQYSEQWPFCGQQGGLLSLEKRWPYKSSFKKLKRAKFVSNRIFKDLLTVVNKLYYWLRNKEK